MKTLSKDKIEEISKFMSMEPNVMFGITVKGDLSSIDDSDSRTERSEMFVGIHDGNLHLLNITECEGLYFRLEEAEKILEAITIIVDGLKVKRQLEIK